MSYRCENYKETTPASGWGSVVCVVMEEMIALPKKELPGIVQWYKGELTSNALLNRAGHLAAKKNRLLADPSLDAAQALQQTQPLSRALREATKRLRQLPGAEGPGVAVDEEEEDENLVSTALEKWMKRMVQSGLKREPKTPPPPPPATARPALKRPTATSSTVPAKKTTKKPGPSPKKKKKKSFMRGMLEEGLLAGYKSVDPTPRARRRFNPAEGWEDWADGRKLRRPLAGNDY